MIKSRFDNFCNLFIRAAAASSSIVDISQYRVEEDAAAPPASVVSAPVEDAPPASVVSAPVEEAAPAPVVPAPVEEAAPAPVEEAAPAPPVEEAQAEQSGWC